MTQKRGRQVSRRGLFSIFSAPAKSLRDSLEREAATLKPGAAPAGASQPASGYPRRLRPADETIVALREESGVLGVDLRRFPLAVGRSWRVVSEGLAEPLLVVRVSADHVAAVGGECPMDGSDLMWLAFEDRVACVGCGSRWRLDGDVMRAPADSPLASFPAQETDGVLRLRV